MKIKIQHLILFGSAIIYGLVWSLIYLIFAGFHGMSQMFNNEFIWLIAGVFKIPLSTVFKGFVFAFLDGSILGFLIGMVLFSIYKRN